MIGSSIKHIPIAGRDITYFVQQLLRDREGAIPPEDSLDVAKRVKEMYSYVCPDIVKEFKRYDQEGDKYFKKFTGIHSVTKKVIISVPLFNTQLVGKRSSSYLADLKKTAIRSRCRLRTIFGSRNFL